MRQTLRRSRAATLAVAVAAALSLLIGTGTTEGGLVATSDETYLACGRVFTDPHAYWPSPEQSPQRSPFAKGNAACAATDFLSYSDMVAGMSYLEQLFPQFVEFYRLERDFGGNDTACDSSSSTSQDYCSAGLPRQGHPTERVKSELYLVRITDESVPDTNKKFFAFPLAIHGIERAGAEAGARAAEDLATWAYCERVAANPAAANGKTNCAQEGAVPHPILETQPGSSVAAGDALKRSAIYLVFANPDGWRRGDPDNLVRFYQRYNGNGVDMNRDWPTLGYTFEPYTPWSEPETRAFGRVLKQIRAKWDGGIDLHGQLVDRAFSFTMVGASERNYSKNQRVLETVKGAWGDAEKRFEWASAYIKPNDAPKRPQEGGTDPRMYGVQWGTVWDTIGYTTTGSFGDWIDSPLGLDADGIDNEMSFSHISNCGTGSCYLTDFEQLHVDGNKSLIYGMVNFTLQETEDTTFHAPGKVGYVFNPSVLSNDGSEETPPPGEGLDPQPGETVTFTATNTVHEFLVKGPLDGFYNGGVEGKITHVNVGGTGPGSGDPLGLLIGGTALVLEQYRPDEETPQEDAGCGGAEDRWGEVNRYYNQGSIYLQAGQAVHANSPLPGRYRVCLTGGLVSQMAAAGGSASLEITFSREKAWEDPGQRPYSVTNMKFFRDLAANMAPNQLVPVNVDDVLAGTVDLDQFTSLVVADDPLPGWSEGIPSGPAQESLAVDGPATGTVPCAYQEGVQPILPETCYRDVPFRVEAGFNNQKVTIALNPRDEVGDEAADWDLYVERKSQITGEWFEVGRSTTPTGNETVTLLTPPTGDYRARIVNWDAVDSTSARRLVVRYSNEYSGPPVLPSERTAAERDAWGSKLRDYAEAGGNLVLTDGAVKNLAYMNAVGRGFVNNFSAYAGFIGFTRDGRADTYDHPLGRNVNQPGAAEGPGFRHQTYEPVPIGYAIQDANGADFNGSPIWSVDQLEWERLGGRTAGITTADQVTLGELPLGGGVVRVIGALLPMPSEQYYHPFGLANYALTYTGYQVLNNALQWQRPLPDLTLTAGDIAISSEKVKGGDRVTITATVHNVGAVRAANVPVTFQVNGAQVGAVQTIAGIPAGGSGTASVVWDTKHLKGEQTITVTADPANAIAEGNEDNNSASRTVVVRGNKVQNGSFEASSSGSAPDAWSSSGSTDYGSGGSDGERSVSADAGGSWTSAPIEVVAGSSYGVSVDASGAGGTMLVQQLSSTGAVLTTTTTALAGTLGDFATATGVLTTVQGATQVRITLVGGLVGKTTFDDVWLWEE
ncbi:MAG TPA: CARDB domain-containing protein [Gaiellaceae bacterium]